LSSYNKSTTSRSSGVWALGSKHNGGEREGGQAGEFGVGE